MKSDPVWMKCAAGIVSAVVDLLLAGLLYLATHNAVASLVAVIFFSEMLYQLLPLLEEGR